MSAIKFNPRAYILLLFILTIAAIRVFISSSKELVFLNNFSPLGAMALFGGAYFTQQWKALSFPLLALLLSDAALAFVLQNGFLYGGWYWVYGAFALMTLTGRYLVKKPTVDNVLLSSVVCTLIHWLITDFGVWLHSATFAKTVSGFSECLLVAIPFELRFLTGTLVYGGILFGLFEWMQQRHPSLKTIN